MTKAQALKLQLKWKLREPPVSCMHLHKELAQSERGQLIRTYYCTICGEEFDSLHSSDQK